MIARIVAVSTLTWVTELEPSSDPLAETEVSAKPKPEVATVAETVASAGWSGCPTRSR